MKMLIGIDLGTYFSEVAALTLSGVVELIPNSEGDLKTPSVVSVAYDPPLVGKAALPDLVLHPKGVIRCSKRDIGEVTANQKPIPLLTDPAGREWTAVDCAAAIIAYLKKCAEEKLGGTITKAVITVPAYFQDIHRSNTKAAARIAGFEEVVLVDEPVAAALHYGLEKGRNETIVVVDFGGGTLDITVLEINGTDTKALISDGDAELGGCNYDEGFLAVIQQQARKEGMEISAEKDLANFYQMLDRCREAKEMLSRRPETTLIAEADGKRKAINFTRTMLRQATPEFDERFLDCCRRVHEKMQVAGIKADRVLLVGGSSRMDHVPKMVQEVFGLEPCRDTDPDFVVAKGAAVWAAHCWGDREQAIVIGGHQYVPADIKMQTVAAHAICVAARRSRDTGDEREYNCVIVPANMPLPYAFEVLFAPVDPGQHSALIKIVQGKPGERSDQATFLGEIEVPIQPAQQDTDRIVIKGQYTAEGLLEVNAWDKFLNQPVSDSFVHKAGLSEAEIQEKIRALKKRERK